MDDFGFDGQGNLDVQDGSSVKNDEGKNDTAAFKNNNSGLEITLAEDSVNNLKSGSNCAGLQMMTKTNRILIIRKILITMTMVKARKMVMLMRKIKVTIFLLLKGKL